MYAIRSYYGSKSEHIEIDSNLLKQLEDPTQNIQDLMTESFEREKVRNCLEA